MTEADTRLLLKQKKGITSNLTRFCTFLSKLEIKENKDVISLQTRLDTITDSIVKFYKIQDDLEYALRASDGTIDEEAHQKCTEDFENKYFNAIGEAKNMIIDFQATKLPLSTNSQVTANAKINVKLPDLNLIQFHGGYSEWPQFSDTFQSLIHNNRELSNTQKFYYLVSALKGEASKVVTSLNITDANYDIAWQLLRDRYENKRAIKNSHIKGILELPIITKDSYLLLRNFLDTFQKHYRSLENLGENVQGWNTLLLYILVSKIDINSRKEWEGQVKHQDDVTVAIFIKFLNERCVFMESLDVKYTGATPKRVNESRSLHVVQNKVTCHICKDSHYTYQCDKLKSLSLSDRYNELKRLNLCINCLRPGHRPINCRSSGCKICKRKHNSILHGLNQNNGHNSAESQRYENNPHNDGNSRDVHENNAVSNTNENNAQSVHNVVSAKCTQSLSSGAHVLLSTALVKVFDIDNHPITCRVLLDSGSQINLVTKKLRKRLGINTKRVDLPVIGINHATTNINERTSIKIKSTHYNYGITLPFFVIDKITDRIPNLPLTFSDFQIPPSIKLADPNFNTCADIDMLLGAGIFYELLCVGQIKLGHNMPILNKTKLGWIVSGNVNINNACNPSTSACFVNTLNNQIEKFWTIEHVPDIINHFSSEERECEEHFAHNVCRDISGRFIVKLPLKDNYNNLGDSVNSTVKQFCSLEQRLIKNPGLYESYRQFMCEYETLGHMSRIDPSKNSSNLPTFYMPHHGVEKSDSITTKLRVVFNGSAKSSTNLSLNDILKIGPVVQNDLFSIILRFRRHNVVIIADITKMYRQILISENQRNLQRIVWRPDASQEIAHYQLNTVTYGTSAASYLATRCIKQIAIDAKNKFPTESHIIENDFYVDDLLSGGETSRYVSQTLNNIIELLSKYGFELTKFQSNDSDVLSRLKINTQSSNYIITDGENTKTLGISWCPNSDNFVYNSVSDTLENVKVTKRNILSFISRQFDPLGLLSPITIRSKLMMQSLWQLQVGWDESLPADLHYQWIQLYEQLSNINSTIIPRHAFIKNAKTYQLHGFSDASEKAFGACVYVVSSDDKGKVESHLLCGKSKVAPLKTISLPRLELCAALLLARLMQKCIQALRLENYNTFYYTDSTIVLAWLSREPNTLKTFVANRTSEILQVTSRDCWYHVASAQNPADIVSRGCTPNELKASNLWWRGPYHLANNFNAPNSTNHISNYSNSVSELPDIKSSIICSVSVMSETNSFNIFERFSSFTKLQRVIAYCLRYIHNLRVHINVISKPYLKGNLTTSEITNAENTLLKLVQFQAFSAEVIALKSLQNVKSSSKLIALNPFIDSDGIIRVGGRLRHSALPYHSKHPAVLPSNHAYTKLIIRYEHIRSLHSGVQNTVSYVRQKYWPLNCKNSVKGVIKKCITCFRAKPVTIYQKMGELPAARVSPSRTFSVCGVDYAGPYELKDGKTRNRKIIKSYVCLFVCFATKATHIELVTELTTDCFLASLKRFVSRRGLPSEIYSDNATNFVGAKNELYKTFQQLCKNDSFQNYLLRSRIQWHFIPPRSPHFGGLWESAVKSLKIHLKRIMKDAPITYEEFYTLLVQVEAVLNSRPITPLSSDPNDYEALTPGHFIMGQPPSAVPEVDLQPIRLNYNARYKHVQKMFHHFWSRWSTEYLHNLQQRFKWRCEKDLSNLVGSLVLLKEDNIPPLRWSFGRIIDLHPGKDGIVRVISVQTSNGIVKRAITKICVLPVSDNSDEVVRL